jgi:DNA-binding protein HU-beta
MTKADLTNKISGQTGLEKAEVKKIIETFTEVIKDSMSKNNDIFLRGFGTFLVMKKAEKAARDIRRKKSVIIPEHYKPKFKPVKSFVEEVKAKIK